MHRKDKSLRVMSQKFVMLFLVSHPRVVSLDVAAKILIGEDHSADQDKNKFKSWVWLFLEGSTPVPVGSPWIGTQLPPL
ncbi:Transcription factor E2F8 [Oryzias melastigma]|uniref:Transcription factor E2F8 n=1 Tax=Oryzias melastigma TaxID=30732 RepID=A0A834FCM2_ORYME|nr:Transcription factor E2F8 [Oryzias melastigma]